MSTPVGQSREQPLHDRQRSSASCTSGARQSRTGPPGASISCSTRARPRVESFSSRVAGQDGHITPPVAGRSARHLPTPVQRWTAGGEVAAVVRGRPAPGPSRRRGAAGRPGRRRRARPGRTSTPGLSRSSGSNSALDPLEQRDRGGGVHQRQQLAAGPAVAVLTRTATRRSRRPAGRRPRRRRGSARPPPSRPRCRTGSRSGRARSRRRSGRTARPAGRCSASSASNSRR